MAVTEVSNFGNNVRFRPASVVSPQDQAELLNVLQSNRTGRIRVMGSKHAWSHAIETDGILLDMRHFSRIEIHERNGQPFVTVGAGLYRIYWFLSLDLGLHLLILLCGVWLRSRRLVHFLFHIVVPWSIFPRWVTSDRSDRQLVMEHELFRHLEEEIFVRRSMVIRAASYLADILKLADDAKHALSSSTLTQLESIGAQQAAQLLGGCFTHHYPVCFRRILPDETLISMSSGSGEDWYSISLITFAEPRDDFFRVARFLAERMRLLASVSLLHQTGSAFQYSPDDKHIART